jgi:cyclohexanone monooxygenase
MSQVLEQPTETKPEAKTTFDAVIVGAGVAGMYMLHRLRKLGMSVRVYEAGDGVGGTWYWNRYPGARCDVESMDYSYSFSPELEQEWVWTERYPTQPEILKYLNHVADRFDLRRDIQFNTRVQSAVYDKSTKRWNLELQGDQKVSAQFCIMATGCLSAPQKPNYPGLDSFKGSWYHTGQWPHEGVDFTGQRVAVIGTGSSAIQSIPQIAKQASHLTVFQRTANFSVPAQNSPLDEQWEKEFKAQYPQYRQMARESNVGFVIPPSEHSEKSALAVTEEQRQQEFEGRWSRGGLGFFGVFADLLVSKEANDTVAEFFRSKIRQTVKDPEVAELLCPKDFAVGTKRICVDIDYYETYNRDNVKLVNIKNNPVKEITSTGLRLEDGTEYEVDSIVFAIGFDAMTGTLLRIDIRGENGTSLKEKWEHGPRTYLGLTVAEFPNMFMITGPGSPSVISNMMVSIEQHVDWITDCIAQMRENKVESIAATPEAEDKWVAHVNEVANMTLFPTAKSWYTGANIPGKVRIFMPYVGGVGVYRQVCNDVAAKGYEGFEMKS